MSGRVRVSVGVMVIVGAHGVTGSWGRSRVHPDIHMTETDANRNKTRDRTLHRMIKTLPLRKLRARLLPDQESK